jgi:hypothetical protein
MPIERVSGAREPEYGVMVFEKCVQSGGTVDS